jgi:molybdopterin converting factor small subunit
MMIEVRVLLGGHLCGEATEGPRQRVIAFEDGSTAGDLLERLGLDRSRVGFLLINGRRAMLDTPLGNGDRVAVFPPELSFNTFVATSFGCCKVGQERKQSL